MATQTTSVRVAVDETDGIEIPPRPQTPPVEKEGPFRTISLFVPCHLIPRRSLEGLPRVREQEGIMVSRLGVLPDKPDRSRKSAAYERRRNVARGAPIRRSIHQLDLTHDFMRKIKKRGAKRRAADQ
jgi:hypothetical protein